jgi:hypothetical protein
MATAVRIGDLFGGFGVASLGDDAAEGQKVAVGGSRCFSRFASLTTFKVEQSAR